MKDFLSLILVAIIVLVCGAAVVGALYLVYLWWYGIVMGAASFGVPVILSILAMVVMIWAGGGLAAILLAVFGIWSGIWVLDWHWFWTCALYAMTLTFLFVAMSFAGLVALGAGLLVTLEEMFRRR